MAADEERVSVEEARALSLARVGVLPAEDVDLLESLGRVLARDVTSDIDVAPFDNSSMDGYALRSADLCGASAVMPVRLDVLAEVGAGDVFGGELPAGACVRIMTGAPMPAGADAVVKYELVGEGAVGGQAVFSAPARPGENVRRAGEEFRAGDVVMRRGEVVTPYAMGLLASAGAARVGVTRRPRVGVFSIGSELVSPDEVPSAGKIRNSNTACLLGLALQAGCEARAYPTVPDEEVAIRAALEHALAENDAVISAGGASKGDFDFINPVIASLGEVAFSYISLRPGKRQTMGVVGGKPVFGLSGNPAAAAVGFELFIRPALRKMGGFPDGERPVQTARLASPIRKKEARRYYDRGWVEQAPDGSLQAREYQAQSSALLGALQRCNCLIVLPDDEVGTFEVGSEVRCLRIDLPEGTAL